MSDDNNNKIRFAIVGAGLIAGKNAAAIHSCDLTELVFVGARNQEKVKAFAEQHNVPAFGTMEEACESDSVDAVYVCIPTGVRMPWILRAIGAGKSVLVEKPIAPTVADTQTIIEAAKEANVIYMDGTMWRQATRTQYLDEFLQQKESLGPVLHVNSSFSAAVPMADFEVGIRGQPELEPLGAVGDLAWYSLGVIVFGLDYGHDNDAETALFPVTVRATTQNTPNTGNTYHSVGLLEFPGGRTANFDSGFKLALRQTVEIVCQKGVVAMNDFVNPPSNSFDSFVGPSTAKPTQFTLLDDSKGSGMIVTGDTNLIELPTTTSSSNENENKLPVVQYTHEVEMFYNFARACQEKTQNKTWTRSSLATMALVEGVMASAAKQGAAVVVESPF